MQPTIFLRAVIQLLKLIWEIPLFEKEFHNVFLGKAPEEERENVR